MGLMASTTIRVDPHKWDLYLRMYPRIGSKMIRDFIDTCVATCNHAESSTDLSELQKELQQQIDAQHNAKVKAQALQSRLDELKKAQESRERYALSDDESEWMRQYGLTIIENRGINEAYKAFTAVHNRWDYPSAEFKLRIGDFVQAQKRNNESEN